MNAIDHPPQKPSESENQAAVAVVGAGLIGRGWAIVFARAGWHVRLYDSNSEALDLAKDAIARQLSMMSAHNLCTNPTEVLAGINFEADLATALQAVDYVQECGPEQLESKQALFAAMDTLCSPTTILASSTSGLLTSEFAANLQQRQRALVVHPVNPPHLVPLVEISPAEWTDPDITDSAHRIMTSIGQVPITVKKEISGFILNRLQGALLNEALRMAQGGYASAEDIDKVVRDGLGLRWSFMGPFETIDLNAPAGLADYARRYGMMYQAMAHTQAATPDWGEASVAPLDQHRREQLELDNISTRQQWRDERLAALIAHKSEQYY